MPLCLYKRSMLVPVFTNRNSRMISTFMKKDEKQKEHSVFVLQPGFALQRQYTPKADSSTTKLLPQELHSASQHPVAIALNCVVHVCALS